MPTPTTAGATTTTPVPQDKSTAALEKANALHEQSIEKQAAIAENTGKVSATVRDGTVYVTMRTSTASAVNETGGTTTVTAGGELALTPPDNRVEGPGDGLSRRQRRQARRAERRENRAADRLESASQTSLDAAKTQTKAGFQMNKAALGMGVAGIGMIAAGGEQKKAGFVMMAAAIAQQIAATMQATSGGSGGILGAIGGMFGMAAAGGVFSNGKKRSYQPGGIASGPSSGYPVMLHGTEAVVPLPDGKSIPVQMSGGGGTNNVVVNVNMETGETTTEENKGPNMAELGKTVAAAVQAELQHQKRPGGILSPFGAS